MKIHKLWLRTLLTSLIIFLVIIHCKNVLTSPDELTTDTLPRITVDGNQELLTLVASMNFEGTGTPTDPIIIEGLTYEKDEYGWRSPLILRNTDLYLVIQNCSFTGRQDDQDIKFWNVSHLVARNNRLTNCSFHINQSHDITISYNLVLREVVTQCYCIYVLSSEGVELVNNTLKHGYGGIFSEKSERLFIEDNDISKGNYGMLILDSGQDLDCTNSILSNRVNGSGWGLVVVNSSNFIVVDNTINNSIASGLRVEDYFKYPGGSKNNAVMFNNLINNDYNRDYKEPFNYSTGTVFQKNYHEPITDSFYLNHSEPIDSEMYYRHDKNFDGIMDWPLQLISSNRTDPYPLVGLVKNFTSSPRFDRQTIINARNGTLKWSPSLNYYNMSVTYRLEFLQSVQSETITVLTHDLVANQWCANTTPITDGEYIVRLTTIINSQSLIVIETEIIVSTDQTANWNFLGILFGLPFLLVLRKKRRKN